MSLWGTFLIQAATNPTTFQELARVWESQGTPQPVPKALSTGETCEEQSRAGGGTASRWEKKSPFLSLVCSAQASKNKARPMNPKTGVFQKHYTLQAKHHQQFRNSHSPNIDSKIIIRTNHLVDKWMHGGGGGSGNGGGSVWCVFVTQGVHGEVRSRVWGVSQ